MHTHIVTETFHKPLLWSDFDQASKALVDLVEELQKVWV